MIDLSQPIADGMMVYPGDPPVSVRPALTLERDGAAVAALSLGSHTGTHVDAPAHCIRGGAMLEAIPVDELCGEALIIDASSRARDRRPLGPADLGLDGPSAHAAVPPIVFVRTGWCMYFGTERALAHPYLTAEAAARLLARGMRVLGVDTLSPDPTDPVPTIPAPANLGDVVCAAAAPVHEAVLGAGGLIVENLRGLDRIGARARVGIFPLPLANADGAPARVVAWG